MLLGALRGAFACARDIARGATPRTPTSPVPAGWLATPRTPQAPGTGRLAGDRPDPHVPGTRRLDYGA
jgi:hypothetical protein